MPLSHDTLVSPLAKLYRWNDVFLVAFRYLLISVRKIQKNDRVDCHCEIESDATKTTTESAFLI